MRMPPAETIGVRNIGDNRHPIYLIRNYLAGAIEILMTQDKAVGAKSEPKLPATVVLGAEEERKVLQVFPLDSTKSSSFKWSYTMVPGDPGSQMNTQAINYIPFPAGDSYWVSQPFLGKVTHLDEQTEYAIDITMPVGTPVLAIRDGVVMQMDDDSFEGGKKRKKYLSKANVIRLMHADGSMSIYAHLKLDSAKVRVGQRVSAGDQIAESGNTGYSSGPHLHFAIQRNTGGKLVSIPFVFTRSNGTEVTPDHQIRLIN